jgi:nicotinate-nucleotide pyrophosphorylase (carboxylating)
VSQGKLDPQVVSRIVRTALAEDLGSGDVTTEWTVPADARARARIVAKAAGVIAGMPVAAAAFRTLDPLIAFSAQVEEGARVEPRALVATLEGPARGILSAERTALNLLQRMSGIATATARFAAEVAGTGARILDTRKTAPGLRVLDKYAVAAGGGVNHRVGLYDMVLVKENHVAAAGGIAAAVRAVREGMARSRRSLEIEVEVEDLAELEEALAARVERILLDNMSPDGLRAAVERVRREPAPRPSLEASGNVTLENVRAVAETGVDWISIGALTHSVVALDLSLRFEGA